MGGFWLHSRRSASAAFLAVLGTLSMACGGMGDAGGTHAGPSDGGSQATRDAATTAADGRADSGPLSTLEAATADSSSVTPLDAAAPEDSSFVSAPHGPAVVIPFNGGAVLGAVEIVTITWASDSSSKDLQAFDAWLPGSDYFTQALSEYSIGAGHQVTAWSVATAPSATLDDSAIPAFLKSAIAGGKIPAPNANRVYNIYTPSSTTVTQGKYKGCVDFQAYHSWTQDTPAIVYAVNPRCHAQGISDLDFVTLASSHEIAEASTDPLGTGWAIDDAATADLYGAEVGDLCVSHPLTEEGHTVTALYSDNAAKSDLRSCVPAPAGPYFGATAQPQELTSTCGGLVNTMLTVYSTVPLAPLSVYVGADDQNATITGAPTTVSNGDTFTLSVNLTGVAAGFSHVYVYLYDSTNYLVTVPIALNVE